MTHSELQQEAETIYDFLNIPTDDDMTQYTAKGNELAVYINRTGFMLSQAKYMLNDAMQNEVVQLIKELTGEKYSAKVQNALIDSVCKEERRLVDFIEQLNKTAKYQIEWCRTGISKIKEEMKYNNFHT